MSDVIQRKNASDGNYTVKMAKGSLAVIYFFNILVILFFPLAILTEMLRIRLKRKVARSNLADDRYVNAHLNWQGKMHAFLLFTISIAIVTIFSLTGSDVSSSTKASIEMVAPWYGRFVAVAFMLMLFNGYISLLIDKLPLFNRKRNIRDI